MKAIQRLAVITKNNKENIKCVNKDLYKLLYKEDLYIIAYEKIKSYSSNVSLDTFSLEKIKNIISLIKNQSYKFKPATRIYLPKPGKIDKRPIDIGNVQDKILLECVRMILEAIFEPTFLESSHGFRPNKSCHTALKEIRLKFHTSKWFIEGDISKYFNSIDQNKLISLLERKIRDESFIALIRKILNAGYLEFHIHKTDLVGIPQGNIISPILSNIYLHELDTYMEKLTEKFYHGERRIINPDYTNILKKIASAKKANDMKTIKEMKKKLKTTERVNFNDPDYRRLKYIRYADDWLVGVIGTKQDTVNVKKKIKRFLKVNLKLELNEEKTLITHSGTSSALFLGTEISCPLFKEPKIVQVTKGKIKYNRRDRGARVKLTF